MTSDHGDWHQEPDFNPGEVVRPRPLIEQVRHASAEVRAAIGKELNAARAVLCADCGHPKSWHTGSFTACNGTARCLCDGFLAPAPTTEEGNDD
jgi:hypothetical protein